MLPGSTQGSLHLTIQRPEWLPDLFATFQDYLKSSMPQTISLHSFL